jgi:hypothetical protein
MPSVISQETGFPVSLDVEYGSNVTVSLVSQSGKVFASELIYQNNFISTETAIQGALTIPLKTPPGLYDVMLRSSYNSYTLGTSINGSYFGQVYVGPTESVPHISLSPSVYYEGQNIIVSAKISYANGTNVKYGMYSATVYPANLQNVYNSLTETIQVPLWYDVSSGLWTGNVTLPSAYNSGGTVQLDQGALYLSGPYAIFVSGLSADGVPSSTDISTQKAFTIQPYYYLSGQTLTSLSQTTQVAFFNDTISGSASLSGDLFLGSTTLKSGTFIISSSQIQGTLILSGAQVTLTGVSGGSVVAQNSKLAVQGSSLGSLQLTGSTVSLNGSTYQQITPSIPVISIQSPAAGQNYTGTTGTVSVAGQQVSTVSVYLDGAMIASMAGGSSSYTFPLNYASLSLGVHTLRVVVVQQDGLSTSSTTSFSTLGNLATIESTVSSLGSQVSVDNSTIGNLNSRLSADQNNITALTNNVKALTNTLIALGAIAGLALVVAVVAMSRRGPHQVSPNPAPAPQQPWSAPS